MSMVTYPLNNIEYTAEDAELFHSTRTSGVYATNSFDYYVTGADNTIVIGTGIAWIKNSEFSGKVVAQKESISLDMGLPDSVYPRIDAIVIQFDANKNASEILVKKGVASSNPTPPNVVRTESIYELHVYHVRRYAGSLTISPDSISDLRTNSNYCGLMYDSVTQAVDATLSKSGIAADAEAVGKRISNLKAEDVGAAPSGLHRCYGSLKDIGITTFPTTMSAVANAMPENSMIVIDTRKIVTGGDEEISDWGNESNGTAYINRGYSVARVTMAVIYGSGSAVKGRLFVGSWASSTNKVGWADYGFDGNENYPGCFYRAVDGVTEWINPPMVVGTEYRTAERYNGRVVYAQLVSLGNMPNNTVKNTTFKPTNVVDRISCEVMMQLASANHTETCPAIGNTISDIETMATWFGNNTDSVIRVTTSQDRSKYKGFALCKYTKG